MATRKKYDGIDMTPPKAVGEAAKKGLDLREQHGRGGTEVGVRRARQLSEGKALNARDIKSMYSYFARHEVDKQGKGWNDKEKPSAGRIAWELWGGEAGKTWVGKVHKQMEDEDEK